MSIANVSASVVTYNTDPEELRACMDSLRGCGVERVWVIDNSPSDSLREAVRVMGGVYIHAGRNLGYGSAHNIALRMALAEGGLTYHLVLNSDVTFGHDTIRLISEHMERHPDIGQLIPRVLYPDGRLQPSVRLLPTPLDVFGRRFLPASWMRRRNARYTLAFWNHDSEADIAYHQGSFMFLRLATLRQAGLFDERFFMYPEDIDLTRRMHAVSRTVYWPGAEIVHHHRAASYRSWRMLRIHAVNMARYFFKWGWWYDPERRRVNREILKTLRYENQ